MLQDQQCSRHHEVDFRDSVAIELRSRRGKKSFKSQCLAPRARRSQDSHRVRMICQLHSSPWGSLRSHSSLANSLWTLRIRVSASSLISHRLFDLQNKKCDMPQYSTSSRLWKVLGHSRRLSGKVYQKTSYTEDNVLWRLRLDRCLRAFCDCS